MSLDLFGNRVLLKSKPDFSSPCVHYGTFFVPFGQLFAAKYAMFFSSGRKTTALVCIVSFFVGYYTMSSRWVLRREFSVDNRTDEIHSQ